MGRKLASYTPSNTYPSALEAWACLILYKVCLLGLISPLSQTGQSETPPFPHDQPQDLIYARPFWVPLTSWEGLTGLASFLDKIQT